MFKLDWDLQPHEIAEDREWEEYHLVEAAQARGTARVSGLGQDGAGHVVLGELALLPQYAPTAILPGDWTDAGDVRQYQAAVQRMNRRPRCRCQGLSHACPDAAERNADKALAYRLARRLYAFGS